VEADVLIVGAGYTGLSTALHACEAGLSVCVLEADTPGFGASGRNAGQWLTGWVGRTARQVEEQYGGSAGARMNAFNVESARLVPRLIEKHGIDADARVCGVLQVASSDRELQRLHKVADEWCQRGASISILDKPGVRQHLATDFYLGGIYFHDAGCLNPLAFARGLASGAARAGAQIYCDTPALHIERNGSEWSARTPSGRVRARRVVTATDAYGSPQIWPRLERSYWRIRIPMLRSPALTHGGRDFLPLATPFAESRPGGLLFGGMLDRSGRWIVSAPPSKATDPKRVGEWSLGRLRRVFPQVEHFQWEAIWWGDVGVSKDTLPRIYALADNALAINGFSGGGIALGTGIGRVLAPILAGGDWRESPIAPRRLTSVAMLRLVPALLRDIAVPLARWRDRRRV
jgi:glycine/D-amino acid oxidase-like deaminating enzyme